LPQNCDLIHFFQIECARKLGERLDNAVFLLNWLIDMFPENKWVHAMLGETYALERNTEAAIVALEKLRQIDPDRMENMDTLSNQYYMSGKRSELAILVHELWKIDKYTYESCVATANYYSLREERTEAIEYFERALKLKPNFFGAWTLIGHEYIELRNFSQAINAYRMAIAENQNDFRAWFGLGQAYEYLKLYSYALTNFMKASTLISNDDRIWIALGDCYAHLDNLGFAKRYYKRAARLRGNCVGQAFEKIARLSQKKREEEKAAKYWQKYLEAMNAVAEETGTPLDEKNDEGFCDAYVFLSSFYVEKNKDLMLGEVYARKCVEFLTTREHGTRLLSQIKAQNCPKTDIEAPRPDPIGAEDPQPKEITETQTNEAKVMTWMEYVQEEKKKMPHN